jgi:hypothetical protein
MNLSSHPTDRNPGIIHEELEKLEKITHDFCESIAQLIMVISPTLSPKESNPIDKAKGELCPAQSPIADKISAIRKTLDRKTTEVMDVTKRCQL